MSKCKKCTHELSKIPKEKKQYKNDFKIVDDYAIIYLKKPDGTIFETLIDLEDLDKVINFPYTWNADYQKKIKNYYAVATVQLGVVDGRRKSTSVFLHKFVMNEKENIVDHIEHNTLDNRKKNLRVTNNALNSKNRKGKNSNNKSGYRNVFWNSTIEKWSVRLCKDYKTINLGDYDDVDEAACIAKEGRLKYYGEYAGKG